jgi:hypothetical protein
MTIENSPGTIKNAQEARNHLEKKQWLLPTQSNTCNTLATILLSLVTPHGQRTASDKIPDTPANTIKAVAFLLEEATIAEYANKILERLSNYTTTTNTNPPDENATSDIKKTLDEINDTAKKQAAALEKTREAIEKLQVQTANSAQQTAKLETSYRDALIKGNKLPAHPTPSTPHEAKIQNRLNISACQLLIEIQSDRDDPLKHAYPDEPNPIAKIKETANQWLSTIDKEDNPPPPKSCIRSIVKFKSKKLLVETDTEEAAEWLKRNPERILGRLINSPTKVLNRTYPVIARFMPTLFQTNDDGLRELERNAKTKEGSIVKASWIKEPSRRPPTQLHANIKIFCRDAETANKLILGSGQIVHLGSQLCTHKDIKTPYTCKKCQNYGHIATNCQSPSPICAKCGENHPTGDCSSPSSTTCTPCGSKEHQSNDENCPERITREKAILDKRPEDLSPYYTTRERWTWGIDNVHPPQPYASTPNPMLNDKLAGPLKRYRRNNHNSQKTAQPANQTTLPNRGFHPHLPRTGANNTPLGNQRLPCKNSENLPNPNAQTPRAEKTHTATNHQ